MNSEILTQEKLNKKSNFTIFLVDDNDYNLFNLFISLKMLLRLISNLSRRYNDMTDKEK